MVKKHKNFVGPNFDSRFVFRVGKQYTREGNIQNKEQAGDALRELVQKFLGTDDRFIDSLKVPIGYENERKPKRR